MPSGPVCRWGRTDPISGSAMPSIIKPGSSGVDLYELASRLNGESGLLFASSSTTLAAAVFQCLEEVDDNVLGLTTQSSASS